MTYYEEIILEDNGEDFYEEVIIDSGDDYTEEEILEEDQAEQVNSTRSTTSTSRKTINNMDLAAAKKYLLSLPQKTSKKMEYNSDEDDEWEEYELPDVITPIRKEKRLSLFAAPTLETIEDCSERSVTSTRHSFSSVRQDIMRDMDKIGNHTLSLQGIQEDEPLNSLKTKENEKIRPVLSLTSSLSSAASISSSSSSLTGKSDRADGTDSNHNSSLNVPSKSALRHSKQPAFQSPSNASMRRRYKSTDDKSVLESLTEVLESSMAKLEDSHYISPIQRARSDESCRRSRRRSNDVASPIASKSPASSRRAKERRRSDPTLSKSPSRRRSSKSPGRLKNISTSSLLEEKSSKLRQPDNPSFLGEKKQDISKDKHIVNSTLRIRNRRDRPRRSSSVGRYADRERRARRRTSTPESLLSTFLTTEEQIKAKEDIDVRSTMSEKLRRRQRRLPSSGSVVSQEAPAKRPSSSSSIQKRRRSRSPGVYQTRSRLSNSQEGQSINSILDGKQRRRARSASVGRRGRVRRDRMQSEQ